MPLLISRAAHIPRMMHVRKLLNYIIQQESREVPPLDSDEVKILRGLFYVHLYGTFEKSVNEAVEQYILAINGLCVKRIDIEIQFYPVALDPWLTSLSSSKKLRKRVELINAAIDVSSCEINGSIFSDQLQNVWAKTLTDVADSIGASDFYLRDRRDEFYLDDVVEKRNSAAHGRSDPLTIGSNGRSPELNKRFDAVNCVLESFVQMLENHANSMMFIKESQRANYSF